VRSLLNLEKEEVRFRTREVLPHLDTFDEVIDTFEQRKSELDEAHLAMLERMKEEHQRARDQLNSSNVTSGIPGEVFAAMDALNRVFFDFYAINKVLKAY
jgi:hypothetical protein